MCLLRTTVVCLAVLVGLGARADEAVRADDSPAADLSSGAPLTDALHHNQQDPAAVAGSTPSPLNSHTSSLDYEGEGEDTSSDVDYLGEGEGSEDYYEPASDYWASDNYDCEDYYDYSDPYDESDAYEDLPDPYDDEDWLADDESDVEGRKMTQPGKEAPEQENVANSQPPPPPSPPPSPSRHTHGKAKNVA